MVGHVTVLTDPSLPKLEIMIISRIHHFTRDFFIGEIRAARSTRLPCEGKRAATQNLKLRLHAAIPSGGHEM